MTSRFQDKFDRADGDIGSNYEVPCGGVIISDEAVIPINAELVQSGASPLFPAGVTALKTQVLYTQDGMDGPNYVVRSTFAHDETEPSGRAPDGVLTEPSFTILARMTKDPLLYDLGVDEDPACYDQGYGARFTFPLDETAPVLKIIKYQPRKRLPDLTSPSSVEIDGAIVLVSVVLNPADLNLDPSFDADTWVAGDGLPYRGQWQDARLRIRRADREVILEVYLNDRNMNQPKLTYTDKRDPLWGAVGRPGFEFLSATLDAQPTGVSPYSLAGLSVLRCGIFEAATFRDVTRPVRVAPGGEFTYSRVVQRAITIVEKNGDAKYNATTGAATKQLTYLDFVLDAEADIIRMEGYYQWLLRSERIYLIEEQGTYEMPEDFGLLLQIRPGNWNSVPLGELDPSLFRQRLGGVDKTGGRPTVYTWDEVGPNNRPSIRLFPIPQAGSIQTTGVNKDDDPFFVVDYYARQIFPDEPDVQMPLIPQEHIDVLVWGAATHALALDTDSENARNVASMYASKLKRLVRANNRNVTYRPRARSAADVDIPSVNSRIPLLRSTQLETLLI